MSTLQKFGVPLGDGTCKPLMQPLYRYRFRVSRCPEQITLNMVNMTIDNVAKEINMWVRVTVEPESMLAALEFGNYRNFIIDHMDGGVKTSHYSLAPTQLKLIQHTFDLDYSDSAPVTHHYVWSFDHLDLYVPEGRQAPNQMPLQTSDFPTPEQAVAALEKKVTSKRPPAKDDDYRQDAGC